MSDPCKTCDIAGYGCAQCPHFDATIATEQQPEPKTGNGDVWLLVLADMEARRTEGIRRYGTPLQPHNGRDALVDAYQEALDLACYLRQLIEERP